MNLPADDKERGSEGKGEEKYRKSLIAKCDLVLSQQRSTITSPLVSSFNNPALHPRFDEDSQRED